MIYITGYEVSRKMLSDQVVSHWNEEKKEIGNEWKHMVQTRDLPKRVKNSRELETSEENDEGSMRSNRQANACLYTYHL